ncbi:MAG: transporter substrate-binding domain-containing protein [Burkholderiales bacterium]|nr:transporter substrate-binding domain-containing protein [Burkholderiales bacterium]
MRNDSLPHRPQYRLQTAIILICLTTARATDLPPLDFVVSTTNSAPLQLSTDGAAGNGIVGEISAEIARRLGRQARFVVTSRKRIEDDLRAGRADAICYATPQWVNAPLTWTAPFIPNAEVILMRRDAPTLASLGELRGKTVGTVLGYAYPQLTASLGDSYVRDDAPTMQVNVRKLLAGRTQYAIVDSLSLAYEARTTPELRSLPTLPTSQFKAQCGFSPRLAISAEQINRAVSGLERDGTLAQILARYR